MLMVEGFAETDRSDRYVTQLSRHASQMQRHSGQSLNGHHEAGQPPRVEGVDEAEGEAMLTFPEGRCIARALPGGLRVRVEEEDEDGLQRIQTGVGERLRTLGSKDGLQVAWSVPEGTG